MFRKVLIANRGAIACRIVRTLRKMGVGSVAVYAPPDRHSLHVRQADEAVPVPSYLDGASLLEAARQTGAEAIHPGYGFLSENADFAEACASAGIVFLGPTPAQMRAFGLKHTARRIASENGAPLLPGTELLNSVEEAVAAADGIGYPLMLKSTAGGGGIGMRLCASQAELAGAYAAVQHLSQASFGASGLYLEKFVANARHIEVQIFGTVALGERDCSVQRRNQKVIEETPAPGLDARQLLATAVRLAKAVNYQSAGTVEFIYDVDTARFYFLEVNTRLQVEHGVTEEVTGIDLVECMVRQALPDVPKACGHSIQVRLYAEDPARNFQPSAGQLSLVVWPPNARIETWVESGTEITPYYDPMLAKIIVRGATRGEAVRKMRAALAATRIYGIETNIEYLRQVCAHPAFEAGGISTSFLRDFPYRSDAVEVVEPGTQTTVQDYPGRLGYWHVGVPPSGPMDALSFRLANRLVGNPEDAAGLEITIAGPTLRFTCDTTIALTGGKLNAPHSQAFPVKAGETLELGAIQGPGARAYLAIAGGFDVPEYLGSRSTFILGKFVRPLQVGQTIGLRRLSSSPAGSSCPPPNLTHTWQIAVMYGPHGAPDFFTAEDIETFFSTAWKVHHNSDRTGVRLIGPKPAWARRDGGEAGLHPSNIHDNAYAIGTVDFTGDMPVILGPDGPSLGGFVCPATIIDAELWKIGQLKPGDLVRFTAVSLDQAIAMEAQLDQALATLDGNWPEIPAAPVREEPILNRERQRAVATNPRPLAPAPRPQVVVRSDGDKYLLIEYGPNVLDLNLRFRVHALESGLRAEKLAGIIDITPGVRSLHIHYDSRRLRRETLLGALDSVECRIPDLDDIVVPSRIVHLPLSWDDPATQLAIRKYTQSVRPDAPWAPSNIEFIRRINGLSSTEEVRRIVFDANYLVLGLGDVYLGAPVATPTDPRHRLVTTKYNPARTWTPENAVGIGGAYLCVYGMEGPGGYQFVGRTLQMWNTHHADPPWLLQFFDQIRFYPVSAEELLEIRDTFPHGGYPLRIEPQDFRLRDYHAFLRCIEADSARFKRTQQEAFLAERERWAASGLDTYREPPDIAVPAGSEGAVPEGCRAVLSPVTASVWSIAVEAGQRVEAGDRLVILEAMKMEIAVAAPFAGRVEELNCAPGALVSAGQNLVTVRSLPQ